MAQEREYESFTNLDNNEFLQQTTHPAQRVVQPRIWYVDNILVDLN